ncbi:MAG: hypothetical protein MI824_02530 [Hyphomicrobiales bacterium]|nr:hypothetical protein [Hyphomicrobiales bacterium]
MIGKARVLCLAGVMLALGGVAAHAQPYPSGLSDAAIAKFETYDAKIASAIRDSKSRGAKPVELAKAFPKDYVLAIFREVFGSEWGPIREYADAALAELPQIEPPARLAKTPVHAVNVSKENIKLFDALAKAPAFEEGLATAQLWNPQVVVAASAMMILARTSPEEIAHHSVTSGFASRRLVRSTWRGRDALILYEGGWIFAINYVRSPRGLIVATNIGLYER